MKDCFQGLSPRLVKAMEAAVSASPAAFVLVDGEGKIHLASPSLGAIVGIPWPELVGRHYQDLFPVEEHLAMAQRLENPPDPQLFFPTRIRSPKGCREVDGRCYRLDIPEESWTVLVLLDVTGERRLLRKLGGISRVAASLAYAGGLEATLNSLAERVVEASEALAASVFLVEEQGDDFRFRVGGTHGLPRDNLKLVEEALAAHRQAAEAGIEMPPVTARRTGQPAIVTGIRNWVPEVELDRLPPSLVQLMHLARNMTWNTMVAVPMMLAGRFRGTLNCYYTAGPPETAELTFLKTLADLAAVAVENARLVEESERQAIVQERRRLARELHDSVSQALYGISLGAKTVQARWDSDRDKARQSLDYVLELAEGAGKEMRALLYSLRPESLDEEGLVQALRRQAEALQARYGIQVDFTVDAEPLMDPARRLALFRVASESLHNVVKHSGASQVYLSLARQEQEVQLEVRDDGVGFDPGDCGPDHYGLDSMRERLEGAGGRWILESRPGQGTTIRAWLPLLAGQT